MPEQKYFEAGTEYLIGFCRQKLRVMRQLHIPKRVFIGPAGERIELQIIGEMDRMRVYGASEQVWMVVFDPIAAKYYAVVRSTSSSGATQPLMPLISQLPLPVNYAISGNGQRLFEYSTIEGISSLDVRVHIGGVTRGTIQIPGGGEGIVLANRAGDRFVVVRNNIFAYLVTYSLNGSGSVFGVVITRLDTLIVPPNPFSLRLSCGIDRAFARAYFYYETDGFSGGAALVYVDLNSLAVVPVMTRFADFPGHFGFSFVLYFPSSGEPVVSVMSGYQSGIPTFGGQRLLEIFRGGVLLASDMWGPNDPDLFQYGVYTAVSADGKTLLAGFGEDDGPPASRWFIVVQPAANGSTTLRRIVTSFGYDNGVLSRDGTFVVFNGVDGGTTARVLDLNSEATYTIAAPAGFFFSQNQGGVANLGGPSSGRNSRFLARDDSDNLPLRAERFAFPGPVAIAQCLVAPVRNSSGAVINYSVTTKWIVGAPTAGHTIVNTAAGAVGQTAFS